MTDPGDRRTSPRMLSRRQVLAGLSATGATGALGASGSAAYFSDSEIFENGTLGVGSLALDLCWEPADRQVPCDPVDGTAVSIDLGELEPGVTQTGSIRCSLAEGSNPAWLWLRSPCAAEACGVDGLLEVTLWYDETCDGVRGDAPPVVAGNGEPIESVSLCRALNLLASGTQLHGEPTTSGPPSPLEPDDDCCLGLSWTLTEAPCVSDRATIEFDFYAEQVRHNPDPVAPWPDPECQVDCSVECDTECTPASFVAFCTDTGPIEMDVISSLSWTDETVTWRSDSHLDSVVLYYGPPTFETFAPEDGFPAGTSHTITRGEGEALAADQAAETYGQSTNDPCPDVASEGCGVRYNFPETEDDSGSWDCVCGPPGANRDCGGDADA